ncbi:iron complex transport system substrate-binding protein [Pricia antarctica]|uniref:Iron complex transport system substrate-binding protein n=1 Tax=Pricia antarctica TaxID=641691 RepID=A0A1G7EQK8_9FLAO|nr:iron complex transport system substrate-binding protein [Pricia antarctica]
MIFLISFVSCKDEKKESLPTLPVTQTSTINYAKGFSIEKSDSGLTIIKVASPWPDAKTAFTYALIPKKKMAAMTLNKDEYDAVVAVPVERIVVTSTTHIPALEALGVGNRLVGFPNTKYISSEATRKRIDAGQVKELGNNEAINTEMVLELNPEVVVGFGVDGQNKAYSTLQRANISVVYNGDWTEETPLGKAEWIKFFAPFFNKDVKADSIFKGIKTSYLEAKALAKTANKKPTVLSGALYKDVWYLPGGNSWMAQFFSDAHADYLWTDTQETGSISLSLESVFEKGKLADFWISPAQFTSYKAIQGANRHYLQFDAFKNQNIYSYAGNTGETGGVLYYELAPQRPDLVLKDLIHIFHPELLPDHELFFFKPLD